jgi:nitrogen-specific signal transduction histidine kinase
VDQLQQVFWNLLKNARHKPAPTAEQSRFGVYSEPASAAHKDGTGRLQFLCKIEIIDRHSLPSEAAARSLNHLCRVAKIASLGLALVSKGISDHEGWIAVSVQAFVFGGSLYRPDYLHWNEPPRERSVNIYEVMGSKSDGRYCLWSP